jgi:hypothetical protein
MFGLHFIELRARCVQIPLHVGPKGGHALEQPLQVALLGKRGRRRRRGPLKTTQRRSLPGAVRHAPNSRVSVVAFSHLFGKNKRVFFLISHIVWVGFFFRFSFSSAACFSQCHMPPFPCILSVARPLNSNMCTFLNLIYFEHSTEGKCKRI